MKEGSTTIITGPLGGGKTQLGAEMGLDHLASGGTLITNVPMKKYVSEITRWMADEWSVVYDPERHRELDVSSIKDFQNYSLRGGSINKVMLLLDEASMDLRARDWKQNSKEQEDFVKLCRKLKVDLVFISQLAGQLDKNIRDLIQYEWHCRSMKNFWDAIELPLFLRIRYQHVQGQKPLRREIQVRWKSFAWGKFDSFALHGERAKMYLALETASDAPLQKITTYSDLTLPAVVSSTLTTLLCTLVN